MFFYTLKTIVISLIIIISFHYFYNYLINTFTIKKNKNILIDTVDNYNEIIKTLNNDSENNKKEDNIKEKVEKNTIVNNMEKELKDYYNNIKDKNI